MSWKQMQEAAAVGGGAYVGGAAVARALYGNVSAEDEPPRIGIHEKMGMLENEIDEALKAAEALTQALGAAGVLRMGDRVAPDPAKPTPQDAPMMDRIESQRYRVAEVRRMVYSLRASLAF